MKITALLLSLTLLASTAGAQPADPPQSIYHLKAALTSQAGQSIGLDVYRGRPVLVTMFYGSCRMTCPLIIDTLRRIERAVPAAQAANLRVLMVSIDPQRDTPESLQALAASRRVDASRWTLARAADSDVQKIAALLNIQYRRLPSGDFNHSNVISLLTPAGEIVKRTSVLGKADPSIVEAVAAAAQGIDPVSKPAAAHAGHTQLARQGGASSPRAPGRPKDGQVEHHH